MELIRVQSMDDGVAPLLDRLVKELNENKKVVWLVTGGSSMIIGVRVMQEISAGLTHNLTIYLTDERYGEVGHPDSNAKQLRDAGFDPKHARTVHVLSPGLSLEETCEQYALSIDVASQAADIVIAQVGMGPDGHIFGILPGSPAVDSDEMVVGYKSDQFTRVTLSAKAVEKYVDAAYVFAFGEAKRPQLEKLMNQDVSVDEQPAQLLKKLPEAYVYNDYLTSQTEGEV